MLERVDDFWGSADGGILCVDATDLFVSCLARPVSFITASLFTPLFICERVQKCLEHSCNCRLLNQVERYVGICSCIWCPTYGHNPATEAVNTFAATEYCVIAKASADMSLKIFGPAAHHEQFW